MKALKQGWVALILTLLPLTATAQEHVEQAFQDFLKSKNISFKEKHSKSSNPETLQKEGQLDAYSFKAKRWNDKMLDGIKEAMNLDRDKAYKEVWGDDDDFLNETMSIYYNDKESVKIGFEFDKYLLICFADTENRGFRYAYAVEWSEIRKEGMLIKAYARIPDAKSNQKSNRFIFDTGFGDLKKYGMDRKSLNLDSIMSSLNTDSLFQLPESIIKDGAIINIRTNNLDRFLNKRLRICITCSVNNIIKIQITLQRFQYIIDKEMELRIIKKVTKTSSCTFFISATCINIIIFIGIQHQ